MLLIYESVAATNRNGRVKPRLRKDSLRNRQSQKCTSQRIKFLSAAFHPHFCVKQPLMQTNARSCSSFTRVSPQPIETAELSPAFGKILSAADSRTNLRARGSSRVLNAHTRRSQTLRGIC
ncbi:hypothetical protein CEXT_519941 [Caerostris extrusa]|uniref:Uncharacterized protein n=1 Tax=Caerostris extrusa TaxID=172846 RepID=A0AAV4X687_CAEEX|nr:hypothetical protein CEXT_519941 [Caerostris extrusa]